jgi:ketosteroid isomerase-like protein
MPSKTPASTHNSSAEELETAFYDAISRADLDGLMALWADEEEIVCIHPGARRLIGHNAIRSSWESIFERGSIEIHATRLHVTHNMLTAIHSVIEEVKRNQAAQGAPQEEAHIIATNVYMKTPQGWRIVVHHAAIAAGKPPIDIFKASVLH